MNFTTEIVMIKDITHDVRSFELKKPYGFRFIPGQYCLVSLLDNKKFEGESIPLTFSSSPDDEMIELTVKKIGDFTEEMFNLSVGQKIAIDGPKGEKLNFNEDIKGDVVFIAGGSGVTPFISAIRYAVFNNLKNRFYLFFSNKTREDILFLDELNKIRYNYDNISVINTITTETCSSDEKILKGRINREMIENHLKNPKDFIYYICGPPKMVESMREMLLLMGVGEDMIRSEDWQIPGKGG